MSASATALFNCGVIINPPLPSYDCDRLGMMNSALSPSAFSQSSVDSQDSSSNMSAPSPMSVTLSPQTYQNIMVLSPDQVGVGLPYLRIIEQPVEKFRFRYKSEMMGTHGSILGRSSDKNRKKTYPTVELCNYDGPAIVRCSLYTTHPNKSQRAPHTHRLVVRADNEDKDDPHELPVSADVGYTAVFQGMGIIHTAKKHIADELVKKKRLRHLELLRSRNMNVTGLSTRDEINIRAEAEAEAKKMNLNSVSLCFEAFVRENGVLQPICIPEFSLSINNMKSALTGELKICRIDKHVSSCLGNEEVFILVEKVGKKNIKIKFFELDDEDNEVWYDYGKFSELDVHHQYAIVFRTPPYRDTEIDKTVDVFLQLYRPTDGDCSEPIKFAYKPSEKTGRARKRQRTSQADDVPTAVVVQGQVFNNPLLGQSAHLPMGSPDSGLLDLNHLDTPPDLFEAVLNEDTTANGMNSSEFKDFIKNLSYSSLGSAYAETFENDVFQKDGLFPRDITSMDISTDGTSRIKGKKRVPQLIRERVVDNSVAAKLSRVSIDDEGKKEVRVNTATRKEVNMEGDQLARWAVARLNETLLDKPSANLLESKVRDIFSRKRPDGDGPLHCAILFGLRDLLKQMFTILGKGQYRMIINDHNRKDETPLHLAVIQNQADTVKTLLAIGANPNSVNKEGNSPLHVAVSSDRGDCISELLSKENYSRYSNNIDYDLMNYEGCSPLHVAVRTKNLSAVKKLVSANADVNKKDSSLERTTLHIAVEEGSVAITKFLLENTNIDVNARNMPGNTALHYAVTYDGPEAKELCELLLAHKADPSIENFVVDKSKPVDNDVEIKDEPESEDEDDFELKIDMSENEDGGNATLKPHGQTSFDLASNKKDILELLRKVEQSMVPGVADDDDDDEEEMVEVKEEPSESPILEDVLGEMKNGLFDAETLNKLCHLLDKSEGWVNLAELLDYGFFVASIRNTVSPTKMLFNYADLNRNVSIQDIRSFLEALDEHEAVAIVDQMLARSVASSSQAS